MHLWIATRNRKKVVEIEACLAGLDVSLSPLPDDAPEVVEDGATFVANAAKKAESAARFCGGWALADDSGLEVDALAGAPGVHSARFAGVAGGDADAANNALLIERLRDVGESDRKARFRCVIALASRAAATRWFEGVVEGVIVDEPRGDGGFGYDPLFYYPPFARTFGEVELELKNTVSHRAKALASLRSALVDEVR